MRVKGANGVGRFSVEFDVANYVDSEMAQRGLLPPNQVRRETISGVVDSGAAKLVLPGAVVKRLGLTLGDPINVRYADGRRARRREARGVLVRLLGREGTFTAIVEPKRDTAMIGAIVLEDLDLLVDCIERRVHSAIPVGRSMKSSEFNLSGARLYGVAAFAVNSIPPLDPPPSCNSCCIRVR